MKVKAIGSLEITDSKGGTDVPVIGVEKVGSVPITCCTLQGVRYTG